MRPSIAIVVIIASIQSLDCLSGISNSRFNYFDIDLLRYVAEGKSGNVMLSPASIKSTLAMLLEGAQGATAAEIQTALRLIPNKEDYREQLNHFIRDLEVNSSSVSVSNANGLFVSKQLQLKKEYEMLAKRLYFSEVNKLDFNDPRTAADVINGWVNSKTRGLIPAILEQAHINPKTELLLTNALYFKGTWLNEFDLKQTHGDCFYRNGVCKTVAMMNLEAELNYAYVDNLRAHALELPYQNKRYSMMILVPQDRDAGLALIRDLPYIGLLQISKILEPTDVVLTFPKFTVEYGDDIVAPLKNMGISTLFSPAANLSGIIDGAEAHLNTIFHKVYMSVDEKGTIAAAATAGLVVPLINNFVQLRVDRPFLFFIWDNEKGVVLFEGKIDEPTEFVAVNSQPPKTPVSAPVPVQSQPIPNSPPKTSQQHLKPIETILIQPMVDQYMYSQPPQLTNQPIQPANQPIQPPSHPIQSTSQSIPEYSTTTLSPPSRKSHSNWFQKVSSYFG
ncbi:hypothetical protein HF086_004287 [Spodoptera exigua]|uniref:Serpin domain-containing protein n=1 Tax=Spodoptera exigua TaxID=7107 RepID=A0A922SNM2_SPOEX|nr:hypothetical protein HF086_004287 [Spodoptera exigua]